MMRERDQRRTNVMTSTVGGCGTPPEKGGLTGAVTFLSVRSALGCFHMEMIGLRLPRHFNSRQAEEGEKDTSEPLSACFSFFHSVMVALDHSDVSTLRR